MPTLVQDLRYAARTFAKTPGFTLVAILTLALGIGANTGIFSFVDAVLLKPFPYAHPERILRLSEKRPGVDRTLVSTLNFLDWKNQNTVFESLAAQITTSMTMSGGNAPVLLQGSRVSASFFDIFGVKAFVGRTFAPDEDQENKAGVAVLSHRGWRERFGADKSIIGRQLTLNGKPHTVIGVLPVDSPYDRSRIEIWTPVAFEPKDLSRNYHWFRAWGRLKEGVSLERARAEMNVIAARIETQYPDTNKGWGVTVDRWVDRAVGDDLRQSLYMLMAAVGAVLLIGCANLANLTLARGTSREKEVAIRASMGASRWRLARQFLTENVLLSTLGAALGVALAFGMIAGLKLLMPPFYLPSESNVVVDIRVLVFTFLVALATGVIFGIAPALQAANPNLTGAMKEGGRGMTASPARRALRSALVVVEMALAFVLLSGAALLLRSFYELQRVNTGFDSTNVLTMGLPLTPSQFKDGGQAIAYTRRILDRIESTPGVRDAAITNALPLHGWGHTVRFQISGQPFKERAEREVCFMKLISEGYLRSLGIQVRQGRGLTGKDVKGSPPVAVINELMAKRHFKGEDPIGKRILVQDIVFGKAELGAEIPWEVVGVVGDEKLMGLDDDRSAGIYVPYAQSPGMVVNLIVKGIGNPESLQQVIRREVQQVDREQPLTDIQTLEQIKTESVAPNRLRTTLLGVFAGIALLLAAIGIYGVISYSVAQRTHEMGIRLALGASRRDILGLIVGNGMLLTGIGLAMGVAGSLVLTRLLKTLLFGVSATDPLVMAAMAALLGGIALLACYLPARRATAVDPLTALRAE